MRTYIQAGDRVRHTRFLNINGTDGFTVLEIEDGRAFCEFYDGFGKRKTSWFIAKDLVLIQPISTLAN